VATHEILNARASHVQVSTSANKSKLELDIPNSTLFKITKFPFCPFQVKLPVLLFHSLIFVDLVYLVEIRLLSMLRVIRLVLSTKLGRQK
jgi:hypothetical protein